MLCIEKRNRLQEEQKIMRRQYIHPKPYSRNTTKILIDNLAKHIIFIDSTKTYVSVLFNVLRPATQKQGVNRKYINAGHNLYKKQII